MLTELKIVDRLGYVSAHYLSLQAVFLNLPYAVQQCLRQFQFTAADSLFQLFFRAECDDGHRREILRLWAKVKQEGLTIVPLSVYFKGSRVKLELGLAKGKKLYDKRESQAKRDAARELDRAMKTSRA